MRVKVRVRLGWKPTTSKLVSRKKGRKNIHRAQHKSHGAKTQSSATTDRQTDRQMTTKRNEK